MTGGPGAVDAVEDLTPAWLSEALGAEVRSVGHEPVGHGQMASNHRLRLEGDGVPATVVAKLGAGEDRSIAAGGYRKEVAFYRDLAATVAIRVPACLHVSSNDDGTVFTLLLEDMAPAEPGDQVAGCSGSEAEAVARNLAGLHGPRWNDASLYDHPELDRVDADGAAFLGEVFTPAVATFADRYPLEPDERAHLDAVAEAVPTWITAGDHQALLHGDHRLDNLLFHPDGTTAAVDWQTLTVGHPGRDLAYFCQTGLDPDARRAAEPEVVAAWRDGLTAHGVVLDEPEAWDLYRLGSLQGPLITVLGAVHATAVRTERGDAMFTAMIRRSLAAVADLDPFALL